MYKKHITTQLDEQTATPVEDAKNTGLYTKKGKVRVKWQKQYDKALKEAAEWRKPFEELSA